ncbi:hypothetical protein DBR47_06230 [Paucibacter sp. KBW04]|nr:hypothetical protein DBR47_06230 [Paucibacter sp. KBW04]
MEHGFVNREAENNELGFEVGTTPECQASQARAKQFGAPAIAKFADDPAELWPIQEFTYLAPGRCAGTTVSERRG